MTTNPTGPDSPNDPRAAVVTAGRDRLLSHSLDALRSQLNASILSRESPVSRDTAYRVFRDDEGPVADAIVAAVAEASHDPTWSGYDVALNDVGAAYQTNVNRESDPAATLIAALEANFEAQFTSPGVPVGWLLQAAALAGSTAWKGEQPSDEDAALARKILDARRDFYHRVAEGFSGFLTLALSDMGRRPRPGVDAEAILMLMHALHDGAVLRRFFDPDAVPPRLVAEAMFLLGLAFTEEGPAEDPRRPDDERGRKVFDDLLEAAGRLWRDRADITVDDVARQAGTPPEAAALLFPDLGDLADSLVRARVVGAGFPDLGPLTDPEAAKTLLPGMVAELQRLRDLADEAPHLVAALRQHRPTRSKSFAEDFVDHQTRLVTALGATPHARQLVQDMVEFASQGSGGWTSVLALLRTVGYHHEA